MHLQTNLMGPKQQERESEIIEAEIEACESYQSIIKCIWETAVVQMEIDELSAALDLLAWK